MKKITIELELGCSPLSFHIDDEGKLRLDPVGYGPFIVDEELNLIADEISNMFDSYHELGPEGGEPCLNKEKQKEEAPKMLSLLRKLRKRMDELNDGNFEIEDLSSPFYETLAKETR